MSALQLRTGQLMPPPQTPEQGEGRQVQILDGRGCLTPEAMCFVEELELQQREVVQRHVRGCSVCAQQQASLATAAHRVRHDRPRIPAPAEARVAARRAAIESLTLLRRRATPTRRQIAQPQPLPRAPSGRWRRWLTLALAVASGAIAVLALSVR